MMFNEKISMHGRYKFDVYASGGAHKWSSDYSKNFITSTGLVYPSLFAFADCFRFLSIGTGLGGNSISGGFNGWGTTGLTNPVPAYTYIGSRDCNGNSQYEPNGCGYVEAISGIILSRAWRIPPANDFFPSLFT